jgi:DNA-directed RNA polymerase subunit RPC12/RpoP
MQSEHAQSDQPGVQVAALSRPRLVACAAFIVVGYGAVAYALAPYVTSLLFRLGIVCAAFIVGAVLVMVFARHQRTRSTFIFSVAAGSIGAISIFFPQVVVLTLRINTWGPLLFFIPIIGSQIIFYALKHRRTGSSLHCPECEYELGMSPDDAPLRCPECGHAWLGKWVVGRSRRSPRLAAVGALICFLGVAPLVVQWTGLGSASLSVLPTNMLISLVAQDPWGHNKSFWSELKKRSLTADEELRLAEKLLQLRRDHGYLYGEPAMWLGAAVQAGSLPAELIERYYDDWFEPRLAGPDTVAVNAPITLRIDAVERRGGPNTWMYILLGPVTVDGVEVTDSNYAQKRERWIFSLDFISFSFAGQFKREPIMLPTFSSPTPGPITVTVTGYRCVVPVGVVPLPPEPSAEVASPLGAIYFDRFEISKTITVK